MKQSTVLLIAAIFVFAALFYPAIRTLNAQTNFVKYEGNPVIPLGNTGEWDAGGVTFAWVLKIEETYHMWYSAARVAGTTQRQIGYATSSDGINWDKYENNPVLVVGGAGEFDDFSLLFPCVVFDGSTYEMWYTGNAGNSMFAIGYATAPNPTDWTKHPGNPVLTRGSGGEFDEAVAVAPVVIRNGSSYQMWYTGRAGARWQTGYATSQDGITWEKHSSNPVLTVGGSGSWDAFAAIASTVLYDDEAEEYKMWYHGENDTDISNVKIGYATSPDGIIWTRFNGNPILSPSINEWDNDNVWFPRVLQDADGIYRMWYSGRGSGVDRLGYAADSSAVTSVETVEGPSPNHFRLKQNYPNPFNPSTIINYDLPKAGSVELKIYNQLGQEIRRLVNSVQPAGTQQVTWDGRDQNGNSVAAGLYFYRLKSGSFVETRKMLLIR